MSLFFSFFYSIFELLFLQIKSSPELLKGLLSLFILIALIVGIILLCIFSTKGRRILWLFFLSQWPSTVLGIYQKINPASKNWSIIIIESILFFLIVGCAIFLAYRAVRKYNVIPPFSWKYFRWGRMVIGFFLLLGSQILIQFITNLISHNIVTTQNQTELNSLAVQVPYLLFALSTVFAGFFEELLFRVGAFEILSPKHKNWAFVIAIVTFTVAHGPTNISSLFIYGCMAIILTGFYYKYRNFYLNMTIHMSLNLYVSTTFWLVLIGVLH